MTWAGINSPTLNGLSHPGTPKNPFFKPILTFLLLQKVSAFFFFNAFLWCWMGFIWINTREHLWSEGCLYLWQLFRQHLPAGLGLSGIFHNSSLSQLRLWWFPLFLISSVALYISVPFLCDESGMKFNILLVPLPPLIPPCLWRCLYCFSDGPVDEVPPSEPLGAFLAALNYHQCNFTLICLFYPLDCESPESRN